MAYVKIIYQNSPSTATPINAENLNHMDDQIALNDQRLTELEGAHVSSFNGRTGAVTPADGDYDIGQIAPLTGAQVGQVPVVTNIGTEEDPELVFRMGAGGGGGHSIIDSEGNTMPQESAMQFADSHVSDDSTNGKTKVEVLQNITENNFDNLAVDGSADGIYNITDGSLSPFPTLAVQRYFIAGKVLQADDGSGIVGYGDMTAIIYPGGVAVVYAHCKIDAGSYGTNLFNYGFDSNVLETVGCPHITPKAGGTADMFNLSNAYSHDGYGWTFEPPSGSNHYWMPSRIYTTAGNIGGYPANVFNNGVYISAVLTGTC